MSDDRSGLTLGLDLTYAFSSYSCIQWVYPLHILSAYLLVAIGVFALASRVIPYLKQWHATFGRAFMIVMYWGYGTSILIHNTGLPLAIIVFMLTKLVALCTGWLAIKRWKSNRESDLTDRIAANVKEEMSVNGLSYREVVAKQKESMESERTSFASRFLTWKSLHGMLMTYAWFTMVGRTGVTNPAKFEGCRTYPAFKTAEGAIEYLPRLDPDYFSPSEETVFWVSICVGSSVAIVALTALSSYLTARSARRSAETPVKSSLYDDPLLEGTRSLGYQSSN